MQLHVQIYVPVFPKYSPNCHLVTGYDKFPTNKTYFWDRSLDGLGAGLSSDADFRFHKEACFGLEWPGHSYLLVMAWFCDRGLLVIILCD